MFGTHNIELTEYALMLALKTLRQTEISLGLHSFDEEEEAEKEDAYTEALDNVRALRHKLRDLYIKELS